MNKRPVSYLQTDPRWKNKPYRVKGETATIGGSGCGPTAAAMLIETITGKTFTPEDACNWSMAHGYKALNQGTYYAYFTPQFAEFGIDCQMLNWTNTYGKPDHANHEKVVEKLKEGYYAIALMNKGLWTSSGHFVVLWWQDDKVRINDPASTKDARVNGDIRTFRSQAKYYWLVDARKYNNANDEEEEEMPVYEKLNDVPAAYRPAVQKIMEKGALSGYSDPDPSRLDDNVLKVSEDFCRIAVVLNNLGLLD
ncbi:C39 family peptidase [uncultured Oscillibacter sp.]|uniref:C39 family peptidase n=1 Tax=uncultured Oscillibacter sp. TaxID=876091 RepID=UPI002666D39F|nr:C39 family peptidase [uncultured Oscillibacter sp.]